jgi:signal transduction histidine kinase/CheY-like chemotaxis protein
MSTDLSKSQPEQQSHSEAAMRRADAGEDAPQESERVLVYAPTGRDGPLVCDALRRAGFEPLACPTLDALCEELQRGAGAAFIAEEGLGSQAMTCLHDALAKQPAWSDIPIIIMTGGGKTTPFSARLARRLEDIGNLTLLERPLRILTLVSAVQAAINARRRQYQVRALLRANEQALQQRDRFLAMLGHELRNPLAAIRTAVEVLDCNGPADPSLSREHCRIIQRQAANLSRLVDDLLDVARATAGKIVLSRSRVDLRDVAQRGIEAVKLAMGAQRHEILCDTAADPAMVDGDPVRLEQVVTNLVSNAIKYTPSGGKIWIIVARSQDDDMVELSVRDTGEGIPVEMLPRIFEPFVQVEQNLDRSRGGLGMGLPLVKALTEMHQGTVQADSAGPGRGSEFIIRLPLALAPAVPPPQPTITGAAPPCALPAAVSRRVLLIEDSADSRAAMRALMRLWGHQVVVAEDGPSGVQRAQEFRPEVALVDIGLPGLDGYDVAPLIRQALGDNVYLVALTGYGQPEDRQRTRDAGFDEHLVKPIEPERLSTLLAGPLPRGGESAE